MMFPWLVNLLKLGFLSTVIKHSEVITREKNEMFNELKSLKLQIEDKCKIAKWLEQRIRSYGLKGSFKLWV